MSKKVIIIGSGNSQVASKLMAAKITEMKAQNLEIEYVTIQEAKKRGLNQTFEITKPPALDLLFPDLGFIPPVTRAERRKKKRNRNKKINNR